MKQNFKILVIRKYELINNRNLIHSLWKTRKVFRITFLESETGSLIVI